MDRRIDERLRKPRRTRGTPFYVERNYWALGALAVAGLTAILWELSPGARYIKGHMHDWFDETDEAKLRKKRMQIALTNPALDKIIIQSNERLISKDEPKEQTWFTKIFSEPDL